MAKIIFGYKNKAACNFLGNSDGWSFDVYEKGTVRIKKFSFDKKIFLSEKILIPLNVVENIKKILFENKVLIDSLPTNINNHSCDGSYDIFNFEGKKISCLNISRHSEEKFILNSLNFDTEFFDSRVEKIIADSENIISKYREYFYEKYSEEIQVIRHENYVLKIFESIYEVLKEYGLKVNFESFYCEWKI